MKQSISVALLFCFSSFSYGKQSVKKSFTAITTLSKLYIGYWLPRMYILSFVPSSAVFKCLIVSTHCVSYVVTVKAKETVSIVLLWRSTFITGCALLLSKLYSLYIV